MDEIEKLKKKILKDAEESQHRISELQREVQELVKERKETREQWESKDAELEGSIADVVNDITAIQTRMLTAQDLLNFLQNK